MTSIEASELASAFPLLPPITETRERIVIVAENGAMFQGLAQAVRLHFPIFDVTLNDGVGVYDAGDRSARLVLLQVGSSRDLNATALDCRRRFPTSAIGLMADIGEFDISMCEAIFEDGTVQGLLPLNMNLEIWLAVMSLLVTGGEYYPLSHWRHVNSDARESGGRMANGDGRNSGRLASLTARENQVLALMSDGLQNKLIANRMALSEHTVKIHVHNLITKLRVSNRTQAAAAFRSRLSSRAIPLTGKITQGAQLRGPQS